MAGHFTTGTTQFQKRNSMLGVSKEIDQLNQ